MLMPLLYGASGIRVHTAGATAGAGIGPEVAGNGFDKTGEAFSELSIINLGLEGEAPGIQMHVTVKTMLTIACRWSDIIAFAIIRIGAICQISQC